MASGSKINGQVQNSKSYGETGHNSTRSKDYSNYKSTLSEALINEIGEDYNRFTRKLCLEIIVKLRSFIRNVPCATICQRVYCC